MLHPRAGSARLARRGPPGAAAPPTAPAWFVLAGQDHRLMLLHPWEGAPLAGRGLSSAGASAGGVCAFARSRSGAAAPAGQVHASCPGAERTQGINTPAGSCPTPGQAGASTARRTWTCRSRGTGLLSLGSHRVATALAALTVGPQEFWLGDGVAEASATCEGSCQRSSEPAALSRRPWLTACGSRVTVKVASRITPPPR